MIEARRKRRSLDKRKGKYGSGARMYNSKKRQSVAINRNHTNSISQKFLKRDIDIVTGYMHKVQRLFTNRSTENPYWVIPQLVVLLCLEFYAILEYFDQYNAEVTELSNNKRTLTKTRDNEEYGWNNTTFANIWHKSTDRCIIQWTFKQDIIHNEGHLLNGGVVIGVTNTDIWGVKLHNVGLYRSNGYGYSTSDDGYSCRHRLFIREEWLIAPEWCHHNYYYQHYPCEGFNIEELILE